MPDSAGQASAQIGNLIPIEEDLNKRCKDKTLSEKIEIYKESKFSSIKEIVNKYGQSLENFTLETIEHRTQALANIFFNEILAIPEIKTLQTI